MQNKKKIEVFAYLPNFRKELQRDLNRCYELLKKRAKKKSIKHVFKKRKQNPDETYLELFRLYINSSSCNTVAGFEVILGSFHLEKSDKGEDIKFSVELYNRLDGRFMFTVHEKDTKCYLEKLEDLANHDNNIIDLLQYLPEHSLNDRNDHKKMFELAQKRALEKHGHRYYQKKENPHLFKAYLDYGDYKINTTLLVRYGSYQEIAKEGADGFSIIVYTIFGVSHKFKYFNNGSTEIERNIQLAA